MARLMTVTEFEQYQNLGALKSLVDELAPGIAHLRYPCVNGNNNFQYVSLSLRKPYVEGEPRGKYDVIIQINDKQKFDVIGEQGYCYKESIEWLRSLGLPVQSQSFFTKIDM